MNTENADCKRFEGSFPPGRLAAGSFSWSEEDEDGTRTICIVLPGINHPDAIKVRRGSPGGERVWGWDGNEDSPTLTPSIHMPGCWHGYLTAGKLVSC